MINEEGSLFSGRHIEHSFFPFQWGLPMIPVHQGEEVGEAAERLSRLEGWKSAERKFSRRKKLMRHQENLQIVVFFLFTPNTLYDLE